MKLETRNRWPCNRRAFLRAGLVLPLAASAARAQAPKPYRVSLLPGSFDGVAWTAGIAVDLDDGWKTYWRMPGEAGIPPQFDWSRSEGAAAIDVLYPLPGRFADASGETVGYKDRVVFPVRVVPAAGATEAALVLDLFFAVCKDVCIPATAKATIALTGASVNGSADEIAQWSARVPATGTVAQSTTVEVVDGKPVLVVALNAPAGDIFVETEGAAYFRAPQFSGNGLSARFAIDNLKDATALAGKSLKMTFATGAAGIEQIVRVD